MDCAASTSYLAIALLLADACESIRTLIDFDSLSVFRQLRQQFAASKNIAARNSNRHNIVTNATQQHTQSQD
jgi:hypothetical protein